MRQARPVPVPGVVWRRTEGAYAPGERCDIAAPQGDTEGRVPLVWCHGFTLDSDPAHAATTTPTRHVLAAIAGLGYPVLSADLGGFSTWGNDTALARVDALIDWAGGNLGTRTDKVAVAGESMGSLLAQAWAWRHSPRVAALWVRAPLTALDAFHDRDQTFAALIEDAYGGAGGYAAAVATHDPAENRGRLRALGPRTRIDYTTSDELFPASEVVGHIEAVAPAEAWAWHGGHVDNQWVDPWGVALWVHDTIRAIAM